MVQTEEEKQKEIGDLSVVDAKVEHLHLDENSSIRIAKHENIPVLVHTSMIETVSRNVPGLMKAGHHRKHCTVALKTEKF